MRVWTRIGKKENNGCRKKDRGRAAPLSKVFTILAKNKNIKSQKRVCIHTYTYLEWE